MMNLSSDDKHDYPERDWQSQSLSVPLARDGWRKKRRDTTSNFSPLGEKTTISGRLIQDAHTTPRTPRVASAFG